MKEIIVTVEGGINQNNPAGVRVIVRNYDTDGEEFTELDDDNGDRYFETTWDV
ncbi:MAG: hypothetical protein DDT31_01020 [Syntrophomonadaceae bacterium]|nr:hypothetical protein [Bacillota bacterium]